MNKAGSGGFEAWAREVSDRCGVEIAAFFAADRKKALSDAAAGIRNAHGTATPFWSFGAIMPGFGQPNPQADCKP